MLSFDILLVVVLVLVLGYFGISRDGTTSI
jgi:hypothetical protein